MPWHFAIVFYAWQFLSKGNLVVVKIRSDDEKFILAKSSSGRKPRGRIDRSVLLPAAPTVVEVLEEYFDGLAELK
jgi:hypothetical protein